MLDQSEKTIAFEKFKLLLLCSISFFFYRVLNFKASKKQIVLKTLIYIKQYKIISDINKSFSSF